MDLRFSPEENAFRQELRSFFRSEVPEIIRKKVSENRHLSKEEMITSHKVLHAKGLTVPHWPKEWGGANWTPVQLYIYTEELQFRRRAPAAAVQRHDVRTGDHRLRHAPSRRNASCRASRRCDDWWCQGYSEPGAGSDLASLKTARGARGRSLHRQRPEDLDHAGAVRRLDLLPRAHRPGGQEAGRHLVPADRHEDAGHHRAADPAPWTAAREVNEVFFDNVKVPVENLVGQENKRLGLRQVPARQRAHRHRPCGHSKQRVQRIKELASRAHDGDKPLIEDERFREKVPAVEIELKALEMTQMRVLAEEPHRKNNLPNPMSSILKIRGSEIQQATTHLLLGSPGRWQFPINLIATMPVRLQRAA